MAFRPFMCVCAIEKKGLHLYSAGNGGNFPKENKDFCGMFGVYDEPVTELAIERLGFMEFRMRSSRDIIS